MEERRFDDLTKAIARPLGRRGLLKAAVGALIGGALSSVGLSAAAENGNSDAARWCHDNFTGRDAGRCTAAAAQGGGIYYECGPGAPADSPEVFDPATHRCRCRIPCTERKPCPDGASCVNGCCICRETKKGLCGETCCPPGTTCVVTATGQRVCLCNATKQPPCNGTCCPQGTKCVDGVCLCPSGNPPCRGGHCCPAGLICAPNDAGCVCPDTFEPPCHIPGTNQFRCCPAGQTCNENGTCGCPDSQQCGARCCPPGQTCATNAAGAQTCVCPSGTSACGDACYDPQQQCCLSASASALGTPCGDTCCGSGQVCKFTSTGGGPYCVIECGSYNCGQGHTCDPTGPSCPTCDDTAQWGCGSICCPRGQQCLDAAAQTCG